jgi:WD40 repeat protein
MQALGTHNGAIYILDFNGNQIKVFNSHSATVNELSIDDSREYIASCGNDGKIRSSHEKLMLDE